MRKTYRVPLGAVIVLLVLIFSACNFPTRDNTPLSPEQALHTAAAKTVEAFSTEMATKNTLGVLTPQPGSLETPVPPSEATPTTPSGTANTACDRARFVADVTVPDNTQFAPGTAFTKTWRLRNAGDCAWTTAYRVVFDTGDSLGAPAGVNLPQDVAPGETVDVNIQMVAPNEPRGYIGYWMLENASGRRFGTGDGNKAFWVKIVVATTPVPFAVTAARTIPENSNITATCPYRYNFTIEITTTTAGLVTYYLERSDGKKTQTREVNFTEGRMLSVSTSWDFPESFSGTVRTYIDDPNNQYFGPVNITLNCY
ncbi:MAG TPA: NBR1-Ig-like domain-containing protein [Levilinea sp.]|nr:NBR1-Ig-like domain-containing protein [Levilinea sp.]